MKRDSHSLSRFFRERHEGTKDSLWEWDFLRKWFLGHGFDGLNGWSRILFPAEMILGHGLDGFNGRSRILFPAEMGVATDCTD